MYKQVFDYNGNPYLVKADEDGELSQEDLKKQGLYQYTEIMPPSKLFPPRQFDGEKWHGSTTGDEEIYEEPDQSILQMAQTQMQVAESSYQLRDTQKKLASTMLDNAEKDKSIKNLEKQQAEIMLELAEIKGGK